MGGGSQVGSWDSGRTGGRRRASTFPTTHPRTSVQTCGIQRQPQLMGVHGSGGIPIEFVKYGLGGREEVSLTPRPLSFLKRAQRGPRGQTAWVPTTAPLLPGYTPWANSFTTLGLFPNL